MSVGTLLSAAGPSAAPTGACKMDDDLRGTFDGAIMVARVGAESKGVARLGVMSWSLAVREKMREVRF